ncbi:MAG: B12-binding domain-containing radical SAM protein [Chloroflexi bacterium]|nr:B12-binding domain-containing radical SAM protein [Chloroflexota bacterium]
MRVLLLKPRPSAVQFGLAPFFQTEPLGLEYIAAALGRNGHLVRIVDMRYERAPLTRLLSTFRPRVVGISCLHILDAPSTVEAARLIKNADPGVFVAVGGHAAGAYPAAFSDTRSLVDAICVGEGERTMPALCDAVRQGTPLQDVPALLLPNGGGGFVRTSEPRSWLDLTTVLPPDRSSIARYQSHYCCLNYMPVWTLETTRGCPHRCNFCSVWQFYKGSCRFHSPQNVRIDFENTGRNLFIIDDIFWADRDRSAELARTLAASVERKQWILAQSRVDLVSQEPELLKLWRPLAKNFDIFFGFESPTRSGLDALNKGTDISKVVAAIQTARDLGFGVTGNFIIDPDFTQDDFRALWDFLATHKLYRVGFTILTPLPGTRYFEQMKPKLLVHDWNQYDLHHLLWEPRLPVEQFFELYCETWRRTVLNAAGRKKWWGWWKAVDLRHVGRMGRILMRTQRLMDPRAYLAETKLPLRSG